MIRTTGHCVVPPGAWLGRRARELARDASPAVTPPDTGSGTGVGGRLPAPAEVLNALAEAVADVDPTEVVSLLDALENRVTRQAAAVLTEPAVRARPIAPPQPEAAAPDEAEVAVIEDDVIRELARSLRPQRR